MQLEALTSPNDDPALVREKCFDVGWHLRSPDSWEYINLFPRTTLESRDGVVTIPTLIEAVKRKHEAMEACKNNPNGDRIAAIDKPSGAKAKDGAATRRKSKR